MVHQPLQFWKKYCLYNKNQKSGEPAYNCPPTKLPYKSYIQTLISQSECEPQNVANFLKDELQNKTKDVSVKDHICPHCLQNTLSDYNAVMSATPDVLYFELEVSNHIITPSLQISIPCKEGLSHYRLSSVIYIGGFHFMTRLLPNNGTVWNYDGRIAKGTPQLEQITLILEQSLQSLENRNAHICIYKLVEIVKN